MSAPAAALAALRRSITAQISVAITLVSLLMIAFFGFMTDRFLAQELREDNELLMLGSLVLLREDLAQAPDVPTALPRLVERMVHRTPRLQAEVVDDSRGKVLARSAGYGLPPAETPARIFDANALPAHASLAQLEAWVPRVDPLTSAWQAPDGTRHRVLQARLSPGDPPGARSLRVTLTVETSPTRELRARNRASLATALVMAALLATALGIAIARRIVVGLRRFGATAGRIGARDLHERLALAETPTELVESTVAFNRMLDRLQNAIERLSAFSSDLAHDLRTPLGNLLGEAQVALSRPRTAEEYRAVLESAVEEYERLSRMTGNMLFLARADNQPAVSCRWVDVNAALERVAGYFELLAEERGVRLELAVRAPAGVPARVWADEGMLVRALSNLVSNALQYAPRGTAIRLSAALGREGACTLQVANDGPPIAPEHLPRIFERFYRADSARQDSASGSGLGLAIVRSILEMHGGSVAVASAPGSPTVFTLHFPGQPASGS